MPLLSWALLTLSNAAPVIGKAVYCAYDCSASPRPSPPGHCLQTDQIYQSHNSWLLLRTRYTEILPNEFWPRVLPEWESYIAGNMTWEGWFRVTKPPIEGPSVLLGTYGSKHDTPTISIYSRRRHASVWIDTTGTLSMNTS